ncbi:hypothetical protein HNR40_008525 [Nonomuraea endophytica]|uniref:Uncharacterized protein n=1 Tax=Nonomuraea endophytica TaxID=714136 RepID=A0A7W8ELM2_9ACTN|nr:hypothetical protein [Nonomuraea endophytica]
MTALWSSLRSEHCPDCAGERMFEQPLCVDGHEPDTCPDWACTDCGLAVFLGAPQVPARTRTLVTAAA